MLEVLLEVIDALLDNSTLFVEPYVSHLTDRFTLTNATTPSCTNCYPQRVYSTAFIAAAAHTLDASMHLNDETVLPPTTAFHDISFDSHIMKPCSWS